MVDLPFQEGSRALIWSEDAIYNIGFERGVNANSGNFLHARDAPRSPDINQTEIVSTIGPNRSC